MKIHILPYTIYPFNIVFAADCTTKDIEKAIKRAKLEMSEDMYEHVDKIEGNARMSIDFNDCLVVIRLKKRPKNAFWIGSLAHEINHAVYAIFEHCGIYLRHESDEAFRYYESYLLRKALNNL